MKKLSRKQLLLYGCSGMGVNMINIVVGSYLCSALIPDGFGENVESWTYLNTQLVVPLLWSVLVVIAKVLDGIIDIPFAAFTNNLKTRWGRRRPSLLIGFVPMVIAYLLFLVPLTKTESVLNTVWFGLLLCVFYTFYTLTMLTFYATFSEVTESEGDTVFLSNVKSVCDVVYYVLGFALIPVFVGMGINIRIVALIFLPLSLTMLIPFLLLKEKPTNKEAAEQEQREKPLSLVQSIAVSFQNKDFIYWMLLYGMMNVGLQLFLGGINELFSSMGLSMTLIMGAAFAPVPFTLILYNRIIKRRGFASAYRFSLIMFTAGMMILYLCLLLVGHCSKTGLTVIAMAGGIVVSFAIGAFFSTSYTVPSHLATVEQEKSGVSLSPMFFAVQGVFSGISAGIATGPILVLLKKTDISYLPLVVAGTTIVSFVMSYGLSKIVAGMGLQKKQ